MIILDEKKLRCSTLAMIGEDYNMKYDMKNYEEESYGKYLEDIVDRFFFNVDEFKDRIVKIIREGIKIEFKKPGV